jgi:ankyrin repeat protein
MSLKPVVVGCVLTAVSGPLAAAAGQAASRPGATVEVVRTAADVHEVDAYGTTTLHRAVEAGDLASVERLLRAGADVNAMNRYRVTPLSIAVLRGQVDVVKTLLAAGANANTVMGEGEPAMLTAARTGNVDVVEALVGSGGDVNAREHFYGQTAVMWAAIEDHVGVIRALAARGADVNARANILEGEPSWRYGADSRNGINGEALQNLNTNFSKGGLTPLMYAAREGATDAARALVDLGANPATADPEGFTPLLLAIMNAHYDTAAALIEAGADVNQSDPRGQTPLFALTDMRSLLWTYNRPTPIAQNTIDSFGLASLLVEAGADVDARLTGRARRPMGGGGSTLTGEGATPFLRAAVVSDLPLMRLLLEHGADPKAITKSGTTALHAAAGVRWSDNTMKTAAALGFATEEDSLEAVTLLIDLGLDVNRADGAGYTALHGAASRGANEIVRLLVANGARLDALTKPTVRPTNVDNEPPLEIPARTPLDEAIQADPQRPETVALLRQLMGIDEGTPIPEPDRRR